MSKAKPKKKKSETAAAKPSPDSTNPSRADSKQNGSALNGTAVGQASYTAKDIYVLEGLEPVRKRPGMYIGSTGVDGLHHLVWEVVDNSIDEAMGGYAKNIAVTLQPENRVMVVDDGRGIPVEVHKQTKKSALETVMTTLHAGGKFGGESYKVAAGLHGVGVSVVNALSAWLKAEVCRDGTQYAQEYKRGKPTAAVKKTGKCGGSGTAVTFEPDPEIFPEIAFDWERILERLRQQAYLTRGITLVLRDERSAAKAKDGSAIVPSYTFHFEGGIVSYVRFLNQGEAVKHPTVFFVSKEVSANGSRAILVEAAFQFTDSMSARELSFANHVHTPEGGTHLTGFRTALTRCLNDYAKKNQFFKKDDETLTGDDVREGITAVISVKLQEAQFEGQTKAKLGNTEARTAVDTVVAEALEEFLEKSPNDAEAIVTRALLAQKARKAAKAAKETVLRKGALEGMTLPGKLADCQSKDPEESEIFIVEGESAGGCFSGDTKVALTDGRDLPFRDLVREDEAGKQNYCYTVRADGSLAIAPIKHPRITKNNATVVKVILDNDEKITCTPDHAFMLRDGTYRAAKDLSPENSLMPLYRKISKIGGTITIEGYEMVFEPAHHYYIFTHLLADRHNLEYGVYAMTDGTHRHHKDFNKKNNNPDNLVRLTKEQHLFLHANLLEHTIHRPDVKEKMAALHRTPQFREKIRATMTTQKMRQMLSQRGKRQWENENYRVFIGQKFLEFYHSSAEYREENRKRLAREQQKYWSDALHRQIQSEQTRAFFEANPQRRVELSTDAKKQWQDRALRIWRSGKTKEQWTPAFRAKRRTAYNATYLKKALDALRRVHDAVGRVDEQTYNELRLQSRDRSLIRLSTICDRFFNGNGEDLETAVIRHNHKIKVVLPLAEVMDVYDMEVPETHNFALASGVFVHNSAKSARDRRFQAILPLKGKILNVERARLDKALAFTEIKALIIALGAAIGDEFDEKKLRYHRIIIATDADVDGAHIRTLLLTLFYRYFPLLIERGYLYIAQPPLFRIQKGRDIRYAYSDTEKERIIAELQKAKAAPPAPKGRDAGEDARSKEPEADETGTEGGEKIKGVSIQRYKGLGEMNPEQLWETTMDPGRRVMRQVAVADAAAANHIFDILMGDEVFPRKKFIQTHAKAVKNIDI